MPWFIQFLFSARILDNASLVLEGPIFYQIVWVRVSYNLSVPKMVKYRAFKVYIKNNVNIPPFKGVYDRS